MMVRRTVVRGWQKMLVVIFLTAAGCSIVLLNRCRLHPLGHDGDDGLSADTLQLPIAGGDRSSHHHHPLPEEARPPLHSPRHHLQQEDQRAAYTRHLLQQIAQLEQEVAALHAAAAAARQPPFAAGPAPEAPAEAPANPHPISDAGLEQPPPATPRAVDPQVSRQPRLSGAQDASKMFLLNSSSKVVLDGPCSSILRQQILNSEVVKGVPLNNEYEVVPFSHFSWSRVYPSELGLGKRVVEKPIGYRRKDLLSALTSALEHLNARQSSDDIKFSVDDFVEGSFRSIPTVGMQYDLVFRDKSPSRGNPSGRQQAALPELSSSHASSKEGSSSHPLNDNKISKDFARNSKDYNALQEERRKEEGSGNKTAKQEMTTSKTGKISPKKGTGLRTVTLMRPFAPLTVVESSANSARQLINIILPLSGRLQTFQRFMTKLTTVILPHDRRVFLTVVYFGDEGLQRARNIITRASREANFRKIKLLTLNETFSRGKALQVGAHHWSGGDVLLFMCDVDVVFSTKFLDRCRLHTSPGSTVYYPVIFSLYNPGLVYPLQGKPIPEELEQLIISRDTGFWRDFGYGMTCQYRSDFLNVNGFDQQIVGWGGEDVLLYRKYVRSSLNVIRAPDPGIFHLWHPKLCSPGLPGDQYRACISSRALSEASHAHLGLVAFKKDLEKHPVGAKILPGINTAEKNLNSVVGGYQAMGEI